MTVINLGESGELGLDSILTFGKHEGKQIEDLIGDHPDYIKWMVENEIKDFDEEAMQAFERAGII